MDARKHIVIIGGGFAGLAAAAELERQAGRPARYNVTLIDRNCYHVYHALLYEVATASMEIRAEEYEALQSGVCIRIKALDNILLKKRIHVIQGEVTGIDADQRQVRLNGQPPVRFDFLIMAPGSVTNFFSIPGLAEYSVSLKELSDALNIHLRIDRLLERAMGGSQAANIVIGGGGVSGVEVAGELRHYILRLGRAGKLDPAKLHVEILEAGSKILAGMDSWVQRQARRRLERLGVRISIGDPITRVTERQAVLKSGRAVDFDLLVWCGGIRGSDLLGTVGIPLNKKQQLVVEPTLQVPSHPDMYVVGDSAALIDPATQRPVPQTAPMAIQMAHQAAYNILRTMRGLKPERLYPSVPEYVIPIGGRWAISTIGIRLSGWPAWIVRKYEDLKYFISILKFTDALRVLWRGGRVYLQND